MSRSNKTSSNLSKTLNAGLRTWGKSTLNQCHRGKSIFITAASKYQVHQNICIALAALDQFQGWRLLRQTTDGTILQIARYTLQLQKNKAEGYSGLFC